MKKLAFDLIDTYKPDEISLHLKKNTIFMFFYDLSNFKVAIQKAKMKNVTVEEDTLLNIYKSKCVMFGIEVNFWCMIYNQTKTQKVSIKGVDELEN